MISETAADGSWLVRCLARQHVGVALWLAEVEAQAAELAALRQRQEGGEDGDSLADPKRLGLDK